MFRRFTAPAVRALPTAARRAYFYPCPGEVGIGGATLRVCLQLTLSFIVCEMIAIRYGVFKHLGSDHQLIEDSTDLWTSDGTVMEGPEATANLKLQQERIMGFMSAIDEKVQ